jgi:ribosomal protein S18 acetylase RimI-like enzyme
VVRKTIVLQDGTVVHIEPMNGKEDVREFRRFINALTREGTYLLVDKPISIIEEKQWLKNQFQAQRKGEQVYLKALVDGHLIGDCFAKPGFGRNRGNINLGIAIAKNWRGKGIGRALLMELILQSEEKWHPKNIYLHVVSLNTNARKLYESLGFHIVARLPAWFEYQGKYLDEFLLILDISYYPSYQKKKTKLRPMQREQEDLPVEFHGLRHLRICSE